MVDLVCDLDLKLNWRTFLKIKTPRKLIRFRQIALELKCENRLGHL